MFIDPMYLLFAAPGFLLGLFANWRVKSTFRKYSRIQTSRGISGAETAAAILQTEGIAGVKIELTPGKLSDHYDPRSKTLRLSQEVYHGRSAAAAGIAAHEVGHAIQHARSYAWLGMRSSLVPVLGFTSKLAMPAIFIGYLLTQLSPFLGRGVMLFGIALFSVMVLFQLVTLPVEFDASSRALKALEAGNIVSRNELRGAKSVLTAAALTYVAAAVSSIMVLLYWLMRAGILGGRRD